MVCSDPRSSEPLNHFLHRPVAFVCVASLRRFITPLELYLAVLQLFVEPFCARLL